VELASAVEYSANELDRSKRWVIKETLTSLLEARERRHQMVLVDLADVDEGRVISHEDRLDFTIIIGLRYSL
jgi:predicted transcriptional regulator